MKAATFGFLALALASAASAAVGCGARASLGDEYDGSLNSGGNPAGSAGPGGPTGVGGAGPTAGAGPTGGTASQGAGGAGSAAQGAGGASTGGSATTGPSGGPTSSGAGGGQICQDLGDSCTECLSVDCPQAYCACYANAACFDLIECTNACNGSDACEQACMSAHQGGIADLYVLSDCAAEQCPNVCEGGEDLEPCGECLAESCDDELNACLGQLECLALYDCLNGCEPIQITCQKQCYMDHGAGAMKLEDLFDCAEVECGGSC